MIEIKDHLEPDQGRGQVTTTLRELIAVVEAAGGTLDDPLELGTDGEPLYITVYADE